MKKYVVLLGLLSLTLSSYSMPVLETEELPVVNDSRVAANLKQARFLMTQKGDYVGAMKCLERVLKINPNNSEALSLMETCKQHIQEQRQREQRAYEEACSQEGVTALKNFISRYPNSEYVKQAEGRISDYDRWMVAKRQNTKTAYENYLRQSTLKSYKADAEKAINNFVSIERWQRIKGTTSIAELDSFMAEFPESEYLNAAKYRKYVLQAEQYFSQNRMTQALNLYDKARQLFSLTGSAATHYKEAKLYSEYEVMKNSNDVEALIAFLKEIPYSQTTYRNTISNRIATLKAQQLTTKSSEYDYRQVLSYATNSYTQKQVEARIDYLKDQKKRDRRRYLRYAHQEWWKRNSLFGIGIDYNMLANTLSWKAGLRYRLGTSEDVFNISIGADYVWHYAFSSNGTSHSYYSDYDTPDISTDYIAGFVEVPLTMKFNFADGFRDSNWYLGVSGIYGFCIDHSGDYHVDDNSIAIEPCFGYNWEKFDWGISYKHYFQGFHNGDGYRYIDKDIDNDRVGMYMILYF